jgi:glycerophosphoryl diester phosphodiesterase
MKKIFLAVLAVATFFTVSAQYSAPQIIANGGYHKASSSGAKNTMSALKAAQKLKVYGSKCDVNLTKDGEVLVVNSGWHPSRKASPKADVQRSTAEKMLTVPHANGEAISTLEAFLKRASKKPATKLIIEIKNQATPQRESELVDNVLLLVENMGMQGSVEYIAYHPWVCFELAKKCPGAQIAYTGNNYDPVYVKGMGITGLDYNLRTLKKKKSWIKQAHKLGLTVNAWTVNKEEDIRWCIQNGVDFITTDEPVLAKSIIKEMCGKQK